MNVGRASEYEHHCTIARVNTCKYTIAPSLPRTHITQVTQGVHTLIDFREHDDARKAGLGIAGYGWVEDKEACQLSSVS